MKGEGLFLKKKNKKATGKEKEIERRKGSSRCDRTCFFTRGQGVHGANRQSSLQFVNAKNKNWLQEKLGKFMDINTERLLKESKVSLWLKE